jgi:uncharacterized membrane protein YfcA
VGLVRATPEASALPIIDDPWFYAAAILAVAILGVAKGGLGGGIGLVAVPLMSLTVEPARAAAILLPILMLMDATALRAYWGRWDARNLAYVAPGAVLGTLIGWASFDLLSPSALRALVGGIALVFSLRWWFARDGVAPHEPGLVRGSVWSTLAGFTSFAVHAGGPPLQVYLLSQKIDKTTFQATSVAFFFGVNWLKLGPYALLGQLDASNLATSLVLAPLAPFGIWLGAWLHTRIDDTWFFRVVYASLVVLGLKLLHDGVLGG